MGIKWHQNKRFKGKTWQSDAKSSQTSLVISLCQELEASPVLRRCWRVAYLKAEKVSCFFLMVNLMETHGWEMIFWVLTQGRAPAASTESQELTPRHLAKKTMARQRIHSVLVACDHVFLLIWCKHGFSEESPSILSERKWSWLRTKSFAWCSYDIYDGSLNAIDGMGWWARYPSKA